MNNKFFIIFVVIIFGLIGGILGQMFFRTYSIGRAFNIPMVGDIDLKESNVNKNNLVISNPDKVVVEQNEKIFEIANSVKKGIVGIYAKKATSSFEKGNPMSLYYKKSDAIGYGFVITGDGWIMSSYLSDIIDKKKAKSATTTGDIMKNFVIIASDEKIYNIDNFIINKELNYFFWKVSAKDLPVRAFVSDGEIKNGQTVMAVNIDESVFVSTISSQSEKALNSIVFSDDYFKKINLVDKVSSDFFGSFLVDLSGNLIAFINHEGLIGSIRSYISCINCLIDDKSVKKPSLGVNYIDLSSLINADEGGYPKKGALIAPGNNGVAIKNGSSASAKLKTGDIILSINGTEINKENKLNFIIGGYKPGDVIDVSYLRNNKKENTSITLGVK